MKEYFTLDESLYFLNKEVAKQEQINLNDLLIFASQGKIQPCFYYAGDLLWREEREKYNYMKGYLERGFQGYLYIDNLGERLLDCYKNNGVEFFSIKFAIIYEELKPTSIPTGTTVVLYDDFFHDSQMQEKYNQLSLEQKAEDNLFAFSFLEIGHACISFDKVFFHKKELLKLKGVATLEDAASEIERLKQQLQEKDAENETFKNKINELEGQLSDALSKNIPSINDELHPSLDPAHKNHAPELLLAVQAWEAKYLKNEYPHQEHTPAITNILKNKNVTQVNLVKRICAITNPKK